MRSRLVACCAVMVSFASVARCQLLYNQGRDEAAQKALQLAESVASGAVFDKQIENLDRMNKYSNERVFAGAELQMRANLLRFGSWSRIHAVVAQVAGRIYRSQSHIDGKAFNARKREALEAIERAEAELKKLKQTKAAGAEEQKALRQLGERLEQIGKLDETRQFLSKLPTVGEAATLPAAYGDAAQEMARLANSLGELYRNFKITLPPAPNAIAMETHLEILEAEEAHLAALGAIAARRDREVGDTLTLIEQTQRQLAELRKSASADDVAASLSKAVADARAPNGADAAGARQLVSLMTQALFNSAAIAARDETPLRLAALRAAAEERAHSIRESALAARGYERTLLGGVQRLALYHKGGIKPQTLAQFISALATLGLIPAVLTR